MIRHFDFQEAQELIYTKEILTAEEAEVCFQINSEVDKEDYDLRSEMGY